ncbi:MULTISPECIES: hypothetical protein [Streptomyces]|nr:hypothetical protein [Streptomyces canarius]
MAATDGGGERLGERVGSTAPALADAAEFDEPHGVDCLVSGRDDGDAVTLYERDADGSRSVVAAEVDVEEPSRRGALPDLFAALRGG